MRKAIIIIFLLAGCANYPLCRHDVGTAYLWAIEQGYETRIAVYKIQGSVWKGHAQVLVYDEGTVKWVSQRGFIMTIARQPDYPISSYTVFTEPEYEAWIRQARRQ